MDERMTKEDEKILVEARERYKKLSDANFHNKEIWKEGVRFSFNIEEGQWDSKDIENRTKEKRPYLTSNKLAKFVNQVVNAEKGIPNTDDVIPTDDKGDVKIASVYNDLIIDIEYRSEMEDIIGLAGEHAAAGGHGYWRYLTKYMDDSMDQEIFAAPILNPLNVDVDPRGMYGYIRECLPKDEFKEKWDVDPTDFVNGDDDSLWYEDEKVWIAEYFRKVPVNRVLVEVHDPVTGETSVIEETDETKATIKKLLEKRRRTAKSYKVEWYKLCGHKILEKGIWPGSTIPIVEVVGHEVHYQGKTYKLPLVWDALGPQKIVNYWLTSFTEKVALMPKAPIMVTSQQISGYETGWGQLNTKNMNYIVYNQTGAGEPHRLDPPQIGSGDLMLLNIGNNDIKDTLGIYDPGLGAQSNERSGKAIMARAARSDLATSTFPNNLMKAKLKGKRLLIEIIPKVYDTARTIRLRNTGENVQLNFPAIDWDGEGEKILINDLSKGRYDYRIKSITNPSRRQQTTDAIREAMQYAPGVADLLLPLFFENTDVAGAEKIAAALMKRSQLIEQSLLNKQQPPSGGNIM